MEHPYTDEDIAIMREMWLEGHDDRAIALRLKRTRKSISSKRRTINLMTKFYPDRPQRAHMLNPSRRSYSAADEDDILRRFNDGEAISAIASRYAVSTCAIQDKIDRLLERRPTRAPTGRGCLSCGRWFLSVEPKSINRRCGHCNEAMTSDGATFLTVYHATVVW